MSKVVIRDATAADAGTIVWMIRALAEYESLLEQVGIEEADVLRDGFGPHPCFECLLAEIASDPVGFALYLADYSTFAGRAGIFVEDLFVAEAARGRGIGRRLLARIAALAQERGASSLNLNVLDWNPARAFYQRLGFEDSTRWQPCHLSGGALDRLAAEDGRTTAAG
jgi:GNAT superfamily N-acetyltransferase